VNPVIWIVLGACFALLLLMFLVERVFRPYCPHVRVRCVHGDEILATGGRRVRCLDCGRALDEPLPALCTTTGLAHGVSDWREPDGLSRLQQAHGAPLDSRCPSVCARTGAALCRASPNGCHSRGPEPCPAARDRKEERVRRRDRAERDRLSGWNPRTQMYEKGGLRAPNGSPPPKGQAQPPPPPKGSGR
jgi:hypothetical protein